MNHIIAVSLLATFLAFGVFSGEGLRCYSCGFSMDRAVNCSSTPPPDAYVDTCNDLTQYCQTETGTIVGEKYVMRVCSGSLQEGLEGTCVDLPNKCHTGVCMVDRKVCYCNTDKCNGS